jgi:Glycosyltransferase family 10 (fucosyltransferase) C-term
MHKTIRIALSGVAEDYIASLVPLIIKSFGYTIEWTSSRVADLIIFGPFWKPSKELRWAPRALRPAVQALIKRMHSDNRPLTLFQTAENLRHDHIPCDYSLSFDLAVNNLQHHRHPYWMEMLDWSHEGISGNANPRYGRLLSLERLMQPLGTTFLQKPHKAAIFASHLREPRATLVRELDAYIDVHGFGPIFDKSIQHHSSSGFTKLEVLKDYAFNLCPENSLYPGYYTEKVAEAFYSDCLPLTWTDESVSVDFNSNAMINLAPMMKDNFKKFPDIIESDTMLSRIAAEPLLLQPPTIEHLKIFVKNMVMDALS